MSEDGIEARVQRFRDTQPPPRGFAAKMAQYAADCARFGRPPSPPPDPGFPVLLSSTLGIVERPEQIQALAGLPEPPKVITVQRTGVGGGEDAVEPPLTDKTETWRVCVVTKEALREMECKVDTRTSITDGIIWLRGQKRCAVVVLGAKPVLIS